jgi:phage portal protein BeeE
LNQRREKIVHLANVVGFNTVYLGDVMDLLMSDKEELSNAELVELEKDST